MTDLLVQVQNSMGSWGPARPLGEVTWCGRPLQLTEAQREQIAAGRTVRFDNDWYANVRPARAPRPAPTIPAPAFTCPRCGGHRSTTVRGQCDDCEA